jgi:hypothetical protein
LRHKYQTLYNPLILCGFTKHPVKGFAYKKDFSYDAIVRFFVDMRKYDMKMQGVYGGFCGSTESSCFCEFEKHILKG